MKKIKQKVASAIIGSSLVLNNIFSHATANSALKTKTDNLTLYIIDTILVFMKPASVISLIGILLYWKFNADEGGSKKVKLALLINAVVLILAFTMSPIVTDLINKVK